MSASDQERHHVVVFLCVLVRKPAVLFVCSSLWCFRWRCILWSELFWFSLLPASLHPLGSQITDLVKFVVINIEVVFLYNVLFPVQAKLPKLLRICLTEHYNKIFKVKSFMRSSEAAQLVLCLVLGYLCCSAGPVAATEQWVQFIPWQVSDRLSAGALQSLCWSGQAEGQSEHSTAVGLLAEQYRPTRIALYILRVLPFCHIIICFLLSFFWLLAGTMTTIIFCVWWNIVNKYGQDDASASAAL